MYLSCELILSIPKVKQNATSPKPPQSYEKYAL